MNEKLKFLYSEKLLHFGYSESPYTVEIDPTNNCALKCQYCVWEKLRNQSSLFLSERKLKTIIDELIKIRVKGIIFTGGGEPLCHPYTPKGIKQAKAGGLCVGLFTNGILLNQETIPDVLPFLSWIRFTFSAFDKKSYQQIHGVDCYDSISKNITNCVNYKKKKKLNTRLGIGCVLNPQFSDPNKISSIIELSIKLGLDFVQFKHDQRKIGQEDYEKWWSSTIIPRLTKLSEKVGNKIKLEYSSNLYYEKEKVSCYIAAKTATITADGTVYLCKLHRNLPSMAIGNINQTSFNNIWFSKNKSMILMSLKQKGCAMNCGYRDFNRYIENSIEQQNGLPYVNQVENYKIGKQLFGEHINFI